VIVEPPVVSMAVGDTSDGYRSSRHVTSVLYKPSRYHGETTARYQWRILRTCLQQAVLLVKESEVNELAVVHGIQHVRQVTHNRPILQVLRIRDTGVRLSEFYLMFKTKALV